MILLNFSHPITEAQRIRIEELSGEPVDKIIALLPHFDEQKDFVPQLQQLLAQVELSTETWQGEPLVLILPSLNFIAALLLAEFHGRMGYFPPVVRTRPVAHSVTGRFEVAEILDLQSIRDAARRRRH